MITPAQCRAARALLDWPRESLAHQAGIADADLARFEGGQDALPPDRHATVQRVLEGGGVLFLGENETAQGGAGVRLRPAGPPDEGLRPEDLTTENDR